MRPRGPDLRVYDRYDWGSLARFHVLDDRQYRDYHACPPPGRAGSATVNLADCPELARAERTILGREQERWLADGLGQRDVRWNLVAQQTLMAPFTWSREGRYWTDGWAGYPGSRDRVLDAIVERRAANPVVLSGDVHCNYVCDLKRRVDDPADAVIASEICGTSITSSGLSQERVAAALPLNPHIRYGRADQRGYVALRLAPGRLDAALRVVGDVLDPAATIATAARFSVESGRPGPQPS
jgi:alkaline phosphatase D